MTSPRRKPATGNAHASSVRCRARWHRVTLMLVAASAFSGLATLAAGPLAAPASAQQAAPAPTDALFEALFPPELIMQHRRAIELTDEQRDAISQLIGELQGRVVRYRWELLDEVQQLTTILEGPRVDLDRALDQLDAVLDTEREIKQAHLEMLVRIKNLLTPEQQATLERLRTAGEGRAPGGSEGGSS